MRTKNFTPFLALLLTGCAGIGSAPTARFDASDVAWSKRVGANAIVGSARLAENGKVRTCAALPVRLAPDSAYTRNRVELLYGDTEGAFVDAAEAKRARAQRGAKVTGAYEKSLKAATCDSNGRFAFRNLPDGTYYVMAPVVWPDRSGNPNEGGFFMQRVTVQGGKTVRIAMAAP